MPKTERSELSSIADSLVRKLKHLHFGPPITHVYNPLEYARDSHRIYVDRYGRAPREVVLIGMNPGPWGMAQTGVPFGDVTLVRDWLGISAPVRRPREEHPQRPIHGFDCPRGEVSGSRLWGWARDVFSTPEHFFRRFFVANYCPLAFMEESGRNRTPDKLCTAEAVPLFAACDQALRRTVELLQPRLVVGIGAFAERRVRVALVGVDVGVGRILHPSPASPAANRGWGIRATAELRALGVRFPRERKSS